MSRRPIDGANGWPWAERPAWWPEPQAAAPGRRLPLDPGGGRRKPDNGRVTGRQSFRVFAPFVLPYKGSIIAAGALVVSGTVTGLLRPWPIAYLVKELLDPNRHVARFELLLLGVVGAVVGIALLDSGLGFMRSYLLQAVGEKVAFRLRLALYGQIQRLSLTFHDRQQTGELLTRVTKDVDKVQELVTDSVVEATTDVLLLAGMVGVMLFMDWRLTVVVVGLSPLLLVTNSSFRRRIKRAEQRVRQKEGDITSIAAETISSIRVVKAFGREQFETDRFEAHTEEALDANLRVTRTAAAFSSSIDVLPALATAAMIYIGAHQVRAHELGVDQLIVFISYLREFYGPTRALSKLAGKVSRASVRAEKIAEVLGATPAVDDLLGALSAPPLQGAIRFEGVGFAYLPDHPVLSGVSFDVAPGQVLALVGPTGAGKSTIASLIPRLYDPTEGTVRIDGVDARRFTLASLQSQISVVLQESLLFRATVRENITYGKPNATFAEVVAAARAANAHDFIEALPRGYDTVIGERGDTLSGGQRQRIAIARALVRNSPILILDEPTTGLDAVNEAQVLDALERLMEGRTTIVVAHKLAAVRRADTILVIEDGRVAERGTHAELLALGGRYARLHTLSTGAALERRPTAAVTGELDLRDKGSPVELSPPVLDTLRHAYDLGQWIDWRRTDKGSSNVSFFVHTTRGRYVLRVSHDRKTEAGMRFEVKLLGHLRTEGYPAPRVVPTRGGEPYYGNGTFYLVTELIEGDPYDSRNPIHLRQAGRALARYHQVVRSFPERFRAQGQPVLVALERHGPDTLAAFDQVAAHFLAPDQSRRLSRALSHLWSQFVRVPEALTEVVAGLPQLVIQGSLGRSALIYDDDEVVGVVDYDRATYELRALDLAYTVKAFARTDDPRSSDFRVGLDFGRCQAFMAAYGEIESLSCDEVAALPLVFRGQRLVKVLGKTGNFLRKHRLQPQAEKDVLKVVDMIELEAGRLRWLDDHERDLLLAMGGTALV